jgi:hypothetical protein
MARNAMGLGVDRSSWPSEVRREVEEAEHRMKVAIHAQLTWDGAPVHQPLPDEPKKPLAPPRQPRPRRSRMAP